MSKQTDVLCIAAAVLSISSAAFGQNSVIPLSTLQTNGEAFYNGKNIVLSDSFYQSTSAFVPAPYAFGADASFDVRFVYHATKIQGAVADGLAFVAQNTTAGTSYFGLNGSGLGFLTGYPSPAVAATFDYYYNGYTGTPPNTIAIALTDYIDVAQTLAPLPLFGGGAARYVRVTYNNRSGQMKVYIGNSAALPDTPTLQTTIPDLSSALNGQIYFGVTAGTGSLETYQTLDYLAIEVVNGNH